MVFDAAMPEAFGYAMSYAFCCRPIRTIQNLCEKSESARLARLVYFWRRDEYVIHPGAIGIEAGNLSGVIDVHGSG
jgi:hypothetical protein